MTTNNLILEAANRMNGGPQSTLGAGGSLQDGTLEESPRRLDTCLVSISEALPWAISVVLHGGLFLILFFAVATIAKNSGAKPDLDILVPSTMLVETPGYLNPGLGDPNLPSAQDRYRVNEVAGFAQEQSDGHSVYAGQSKHDFANSFGRGEGRGRILGIGGGGGRGSGGGPLAPFGPSGGAGQGPRGSFFGQGGHARNICYVIDRSGSMLETFDYVKSELIRSINALQPIQNFHAIFFAYGRPIENPPKRLVPANAANKRQLAGFLREVVPEGRTNPVKAMERAFQVTTDKGKKVQLIYMLTDGEFPSECVRYIRQLNPDKKVKINTISFISDSGRSQLEAIAKDSGGKFKFVTQDELGT